MEDKIYLNCIIIDKMIDRRWYYIHPHDNLIIALIGHEWRGTWLLVIYLFNYIIIIIMFVVMFVTVKLAKILQVTTNNIQSTKLEDENVQIFKYLKINMDKMCCIHIFML